MTHILFGIVTYFTYILLYIILKHQNNGTGRKVSNFTVFLQIILACNYVYAK